MFKRTKQQYPDRFNKSNRDSIKIKFIQAYKLFTVVNSIYLSVKSIPLLRKKIKTKKVGASNVDSARIWPTRGVKFSSINFAHFWFINIIWFLLDVEWWKKGLKWKRFYHYVGLNIATRRNWSKILISLHKFETRKDNIFQH